MRKLVAALALALIATSFVVSPADAAKDVVKQHGMKNYAGPNCPGDDWTCTTKTKDVIQTSDIEGGENRYECSERSCHVEQHASVNVSNSASCSQRDVAASSTKCVIEQTSVDGDNSASTDGYHLSEKSGDDIKQKAKQVHQVTQTATGVGNDSANLGQYIELDAGGEGGKKRTATQDAFEFLILQQSTNSGDANATLDQQQSLNATIEAKQTVLQNQNTKSNDACPTTLPGEEDVNAPCADLAMKIAQNSTAGGDLSASLTQNEGLSQNADAPYSVQTQGQQGSGGEDIAMNVDPDHTAGTSDVSVGQTKPWSQSAAQPTGAHQAQYDKLRIRLIGLSPDTGTFDQNTTLDANTAATQYCEQSATVEVQTAGTVDQNCDTDVDPVNPPPQTLTPDTEQTYTTDAIRQASIFGTVKDSDSGLPLAGAQVDLELHGGPHLDTATTDADGRYAFYNLENDTYDLKASANDHFDEEIKNVDAGPNSSVKVDFSLVLGTV